MNGVIRKRDVLSHPVVTIRCFGWRLFWKVLVAERDQTFLSLLAEVGVFRPREPRVLEIIERCILLERRAAGVYRCLAQRFSDLGLGRDLFETIEEQEREHAELLEVCREAAIRGRWEEATLRPWAEAVPRLEQAMLEAESTAPSIITLEEAFRLVIRIESSEVNRLFRAIVEATDSAFIRALDTFRMATEVHLETIRDRITEIDPSLGPEFRALLGGGRTVSLKAS